MAGVETREYRVQATGRRVWVYYPKEKLPDKLPCVLIGAAGSRMFHGMNLVEGDRAEHYPYAKVGFVVVAYEISGPLPEEDLENEEAILKAVTAFLKSRGGIEDARAALTLAASKHSFIDPKRVYAVGHSSAATLALTLAQDITGLRGCVAYSPVVDLTKRPPPGLTAALDSKNLKFSDFIKAHSPFHNTAKLKCPVFLFNAQDDDGATPADMQRYAVRAKTAGKSVERKEVPDGGHYDSMVEEGIPAGITWLRKLDKSVPAAK
ncbi:MAG: hypothetical protein JWM59_4171 [Verrucomicrobiales bacterium]|nr:hypothetical protein [Verrucomicrobiales bacterium]